MVNKTARRREQESSNEPKELSSLNAPDAPTEPCIGSEGFKEDCFALRARIEETKLQAMLVIREHPVFEGPESQAHPGQLAEILDNLMLSFRHLEDARMRLGKAIQAFDGGKSVYPR